MSFTASFISKLVQDQYNLLVACKILNGYDEYNFLLTETNADQPNRYIFKIAPESHNPYFLEAQSKMLKHLNNNALNTQYQHYIPNNKGEDIGQFIHEGKSYFYRMMSYLEGDFWVNQPVKSVTLAHHLGQFLGDMDTALAHFSHPAAHRYEEWDLKNALDARKYLPYIPSHENRRIAAYFFLQFETEVTPHLSSLRHAIVHNDPNDYNILVEGDNIIGIIDFGDMVHTALVHNLAIACAYAMLNTENPLEMASQIVKGYHEKCPLTELEISLLFYMIAARLCVSVCKSAYNFSLDSDNEHHFLSEKWAWEVLHQLIRTNPLKAHHAFRLACGFEGIIQEDDGYETLLKERRAFIGKNLSISYKKPVKIVQGAFQYLYDDQGNTFTDCVNNVSHVGHCHPTVVKAAQRQMAILNTNTRYLSDHLIEYAKQLTATLPPSLNVCYFTNSGSEANDLAIRMSRTFRHQKDVIVLDHAYHGNSTTAIELSPYKFDGKGGAGKMPYIHKAQNPDQYRGEFRYNDPEAGKKYAQDVLRIVEDLTKEGKEPAAFICETLLGVGGQILLPPHYLEEVYQIVRKAGGVCIADEVQVGFGRLGEKFWGFELQEVVPDIVVMGKPIGNGHPLAAVVTTQEIADAFNNGMEYFNTFGGNPVSMITGQAVLSVIQDEALQQHAFEVGKHLLAKLSELKPKHAIIGDVRGFGLFVGIELVRDHVTLEPAVPEIDFVVENMRHRGFFLSTDGPLHNVIKIKPPMVFNKQNADELAHHLDEAFHELERLKP
jgi:4-aminobutyrate aminotransferase-like enzyme/Ser/Thr protein kinase RdoA (MazF antagonist)